MALDATLAPAAPVLPDTSRLTPPQPRVLAAARGPLLTLMRTWWDVRVHDAVFLPSSGPVIVAANHVGTLDGPLAVATNPRPTFALAKDELFHGLVGWLLRTGGQIPLHREYADVGAIRRSVRVLRDGHPLVIFPEGVRDTGDFSRVRGGLAYLALVTGAPVVPCAILGTRLPGGGRRSLPPRGSRLDVVYGHPIQVSPAPWPRTRDLVAQTTAFLQPRLAQHVAAAQELTGQRLPGAVPEPATTR